MSETTAIELPSEAPNPLLLNATFGALFGELARRGLAYAAWNTSGELVRANNTIKTEGLKVFRCDISTVSDKDIFVELAERDISHVIWDGDGDVTAKHEVPDHFWSDKFDLDEAVVRLRRGDLFEALIHLERALPDLNGLHDAVRKLQR